MDKKTYEAYQRTAQKRRRMMNLKFFGLMLVLSGTLFFAIRMIRMTLGYQ